MKGTANLRPQGLKDPRLMAVMKRHGVDEIPLWKHRPPETLARMQRWADLAGERDGPLNPHPAEIPDPASLTREIKQKALELGASLAGVAELAPYMIDNVADLAEKNVIALIVHENYASAVQGPRAIETESTSTYVRCAEISTALARHIRETYGVAAIAHHNGAGEIQAIPAMHAAGFGELGRNGSLMNPEFGASHRPGFVTTDLELVPDAPIGFGVQDTCLKCNLCSNNCPGDAMPGADDFVLTQGIRRWIIDVEKCYDFSRMREQYCHICVDGCPYIHKANGDREKKALYKQYMAMRRKAGYRTPAWFPEDPPAGVGPPPGLRD
jgi:ferredoxin